MGWTTIHYLQNPVQRSRVPASAGPHVLCAEGAGGGCGGSSPRSEPEGGKTAEGRRTGQEKSNRSREPVEQVKRTPGPVRTGEFAGPGAAAPGRPGKPAGRGPGGWSGNSPPGDLPQGCKPPRNRLC